MPTYQATTIGVGAVSAGVGAVSADAVVCAVRQSEDVLGHWEAKLPSATRRVGAVFMDSLPQVKKNFVNRVEIRVGCREMPTYRKPESLTRLVQRQEVPVPYLWTTKSARSDQARTSQAPERRILRP